MARANQPAGAPMTSLTGWNDSRSRPDLNLLDRVSRLDVQDFHARPNELLKLARPAGQDREGGKVHRHHGLDPQQRNRLRGALGTHRVEAANGQEGDVEPTQL